MHLLFGPLPYMKTIFSLCICAGQPLVNVGQRVEVGQPITSRTTPVQAAEAVRSALSCGGSRPAGRPEPERCEARCATGDQA